MAAVDRVSHPSSAGVGAGGSLGDVQGRTSSEVVGGPGVLSSTPEVAAGDSGTRARSRSPRSVARAGVGGRGPLPPMPP